MTDLKTVQNMPRAELESAFTQRETQLQNAEVELSKAKALLKYACEDWVVDDTAIRDLCRPFLTEQTCDHDGYAVVPIADVVANVIKKLSK